MTIGQASNISAPDYDNLLAIIDVNTIEMPLDVMGELWIWTPEFEFPERGWWEMLTLVLGSFLLEAYMLLGDRERATVHFMRGPMHMEITKVSEEVWAVEGVHRGVSHTPTVNVRREVVVGQFLDAGKRVLRACERHGWKPKSVVDLDVAVARLEREARYRMGG